MKKVFISQPMNGKTEEEIMNDRKTYIDRLSKFVNGEQLQIIDSYFGDFNPNAEGIKNVPLAYLAKSIALLADADIAYFGLGWSKARGCIIEYECAKAYGIKIFSEYEYDKDLGDGKFQKCIAVSNK